MNLAGELQNIKPQVRTSPWAGYEYSRGYAMMVLPFSSGHMLGLRVFPENEFAPYMSTWHRTPSGDWSIYNDGPSLETTCPRWWGPALEHAELTHIDLAWTGPNELRVEMEAPRIVWTMSLRAPLHLRVLNAVSAALPLRAWKLAPMRRASEWLAKRLFGLGDLRFAFITPTGKSAVLLPEKTFFVESSEATLDGRDLGHPVRLPTNPDIGGVSLPARPAFIVGRALARIDDPEEHRRTREEVRPEAELASRA